MGGAFIATSITTPNFAHSVASTIALGESDNQGARRRGFRGGEINTTVDHGGETTGTGTIQFPASTDRFDGRHRADSIPVTVRAFEDSGPSVGGRSVSNDRGDQKGNDGNGKRNLHRK